MNQYLALQNLEKSLLAERTKNAKLEAIIEYLSMMSGIDIPDEEEQNDA